MNPHGIPIQIDHRPYKAPESPMTGLQLRALADPPIGPDRDLFETLPGPEDDIKIGDSQSVEIKPGAHFYSALRTINPGAGSAQQGAACC